MSKVVENTLQKATDYLIYIFSESECISTHSVAKCVNFNNIWYICKNLLFGENSFLNVFHIVTQELSGRKEDPFHLELSAMMKAIEDKMRASNSK